MGCKKLLFTLLLCCFACTFSNAQDNAFTNGSSKLNSANTTVENDTIGDLKYREDQFYLGLTYNLLLNVPSAVNIRGLSGGIHFGFLRDMPLNDQRNIAIAIGAGLNFDVYGNTLFIGETPQEETIFTILTSDEYDYDTNRFTTAVIEAPIELRWRSSTAKKYAFWRVYAGFRVGYAYWYQAKFKQTGNEVTQTDIPEFNRIRLAATLSAGYNKVNFFASYSINPFFDGAVTTDGQQLNFRTLKLGILFYIL